MKKLLLPFLVLLFLISCEKENVNDLVSEELIYADDTATTRSSNKRDVCHNGNIININVNAIPAHQGHGDAVDMDEDGFFDIANPCSVVDCDDSTYDPGNSCCQEGHEIDFQGPIFVALADEAGFYNWQEAIDACALKAAADGCGWHLPSKDELNALYLAKNDIGGFDQSGDVFSNPSGNLLLASYYWSLTEISTVNAWWQRFNDGIFSTTNKDNEKLRCRCVRR